ncbi:SET-domain-containing protein [Favolaschia claudopus]|uniref:SET-domain-containing protein n=1 Tax=Favolaschia claudopus TaxID=2862362 RepID=A0AAW0CAM6_9AGAR
MSVESEDEAAEHETRSNLELTRQIYDDVRTEFRAWKSAHARMKLSSLYSAGSPESTKKFRIPEHCLDSPPSPALDTNCEAGAWMQVLNYDSNGTIIDSTAQPIHVYNVKYAAFLPFPEDPNFPVDLYLDSFEGLQWIDDLVGPDEEVIQFEVVRRLHIDHGVSPEDIDGVLRLCGDQEHIPHLSLRESHESGLLWAVSQRDLPDVIWPRRHSPPHFARSFPDPKDDFGIINKGIRKFCPNLNCIQDNCGVHVSYDWELQTPPFRPKEPLYASTQLLALVDDPCENECFSLLSEDAMDDDSLDDLPVSHRTVLNSILKVEPDMRPCELAVICEMTCSNVFLLRKQVLGDDVKTPPPNLTKTKKSKLKLYAPCAHSGPCSSTQACLCFEMHRRCERNCQCDDNCVRRFPGCNSTLSPKCKCRKAFRECDPEKCTACNARHLECTNTGLQQGASQHIAVRESKYGLGAFAAKNLEKGTLIGEYVGELLRTLQFEQRHVIQKHGHLNYVHGFFVCLPTADSACSASGQNGGDTIDAQWLGNPTRFLNDSKPRSQIAKQVVHIFVNGEKRIAITTSEGLEQSVRGAELTLSYGEQYWEGMLLQAKDDKNATRTKATTKR